jgi:Flp pilus assembly protein TadG
VRVTVTMTRMLQLSPRWVTKLWRSSLDDRAAQIVEFALSMPLLVVFVVGIFDFGGALTLKQKLTNAAREGARVAAADPANDLGTSGVPLSVQDAFYVVDDYLVSEKINDCGIALPATTGGFVWTSTSAGGGCPAPGIKFTINRGYYSPQTGASKAPATCTPPQAPGSQTELIGTCVTIQYAYKWRFNSVITLLVPSATYASVSSITTTATAFNEN